MVGNEGVGSFKTRKIIIFVWISALSKIKNFITVYETELPLSINLDKSYKPLKISSLEDLSNIVLILNII